MKQTLLLLAGCLGLAMLSGCGSDRLSPGDECRAIPRGSKSGDDVAVFEIGNTGRPKTLGRTEAGDRVQVISDKEPSNVMQFQDGGPYVEARHVTVRLLEGRSKGVVGVTWRCCLAPVK